MAGAGGIGKLSGAFDIGSGRGRTTFAGMQPTGNTIVQ
jgi:hypothetical protein